MPDLAGRTLGKYQIIERLGKGGMAEVYKAYQPGLERYVAVKALLSHLADSPDFVGRFRREAKAVSALRHPNIVQVFDFDFDEKTDAYYMVMEHVDGETLKGRLIDLNRERQRMPVAEVFRFFEGLLSGVGYAHSQGMVHRDLKPANVMFDSTGRPVLMDFGIAKIVGAARYTMTGAVVGTPVYMSPEQSQGAPGDERSDIYALGIILYECLTGQVPYDADTPWAVMLKHISEPVPVLRKFSADFPESLEKIILRALAKNPDDRFQSAAEMWEALEKARDGLASSASDASATVVHAEPAPRPAAAAETPQPAMAAETAIPRDAAAERPALAASWRKVPGYGWAAIAALVVAGLIFFANSYSVNTFNAKVAEAQSQLAAGEYERALQTFNAVLQRRPDYVPALLGRAEAFVGLGQPDVALKDIEKAVELAPDDPAARVAHGRYTLLYTSGPDVPSAIAEFDRAIELAPARADGYLARGWARLTFLQDAPAALPDLRTAARLAPDDPEAHSTLAAALFETRDNESALAEIEAALDLAGDDSDYFVESARIRYAIGDKFNAVGDMDSAIALQPQEAAYYAMRGFLQYAQEAFDKAVADANESLQRGPGNPAALYVRGLANFQLGNYDLALADLDAVLEHPPYEYEWPFLSVENVYEINLDRGLLLQEMPGREAEARAAFDATVAAYPDWFAGYYFRGLFLIGHGAPDRARGDLARALELAPDDYWRSNAQSALETLK